MELISTTFDSLYILQGKTFVDARGSFLKVFNKATFLEHQLNTDFQEFYYSVSHKNVIRGMHFQYPPHDHEKLVYVSAGSIIDVVVDLRKMSKSYGKFFKIHLNEKDGKMIYIPKGFAHGFMALGDNTIVNYAQTSCYNSDSDGGVLYNSFGYDWDVLEPTISRRDLTFSQLSDFNSPF